VAGLVQVDRPAPSQASELANARPTGHGRKDVPGRAVDPSAGFIDGLPAGEDFSQGPVHATGFDGLMAGPFRTPSAVLYDHGDRRAPGTRDLLVERILARLGKGEAVPSAVQQRFSSALGAPLGGVRFHRDPEAAALAGSVRARAFTVGADVFFGAGAYAPDTVPGAYLLGHELAHTVRLPAVAATARRLVVSHPADPDEVLAERSSGQLLTAGAHGSPVAASETSLVGGPTPSPQVLRVAREPVDAGLPAGVPTAPAPQLTVVPREGGPTQEPFDVGALVPAGLAAEDAAALREAYVRGTEAIEAEAELMLRKGGNPAEVANWAVEARNALKAQIRNEGPRIVKVAAEARNVRKYGNPLGPSAEQLRAAGRSNEEILSRVRRANPGVTRRAGRLRIAGRIMIAIDISIAAYRVATAPEVDRPRVLLHEIGAVAGAWAGGKAGDWTAEQLYPPQETRFEGAEQ
jgi:uncharacterized protein DUF4157